MKPVGYRKCSNCGIEIEIYHKKRMDTETIFCGRECMGEYKRNKNLNCECLACGKKIHRKPSQLKKNKNVFCSQECTNKWKKTAYKGEGNHRYGIKGELNSNWKSDTRINSAGYVTVRSPEHPFKNQDGFVLEHRLVAEKHLLNEENSVEIKGKFYLSPEFDVHHIDEDKQNNDASNLMVLTRQEHALIHGKKKSLSAEKKPCPVCGKLIPNNDNRVCCSIECLKIHKTKIPLVEKLCPTCGKTFYVRETEKDKRVRCSAECRKAEDDKNSPVVKCTNCGIDFKIKASRLKKSKNVFCCRECYANYRNKKEK